MDQGWILALVFVGIAALGVIIAYGVYQWRRARKEQDPQERREREEATRQVYRK